MPPVRVHVDFAAACACRSSHGEGVADVWTSMPRRRVSDLDTFCPQVVGLPPNGHVISTWTDDAGRIDDPVPRNEVWIGFRSWLYVYVVCLCWHDDGHGEVTRKAFERAADLDRTVSM